MWMKGGQGGGAGGWWADSAACAPAAVIGSHHTSAIFTVSPPIFPDSIPACHVSSDCARGSNSESGSEK